MLGGQAQHDQEQTEPRQREPARDARLIRTRYVGRWLHGERPEVHQAHEEQPAGRQQRPVSGSYPVLARKERTQQDQRVHAKAVGERRHLGCQGPPDVVAADDVIQMMAQAKDGRQHDQDP